MKITLVLLLCSSVRLGCLEPILYPEKFEDEYTCLLKGYNESKRLLIDAGKETVNTNGLFYKYDCIEIKPEEKDI